MNLNFIKIYITKIILKLIKNIKNEFILIYS